MFDPREAGKRPPVRSALDVHQRLLARGVRHDVVRLPRLATGADELPHVLGVDRRDCVAVRCYRVEGARSPVGGAVHLAAVVVCAGDRPDDELVRAALQAAAVRLATPDETSLHTDFAASLVCPLGLPEDVVVLADSGLAAGSGDGQVRWCATGVGGTALAVGLRDLLVASGASVTRLTTATADDDWFPAGVDWRADGRSGRHDTARVIELARVRRRPTGPPRRTAG